ncbi:acyl-CoA thioesterase [Sphingomonas ginkgonis]|uniref:acyl-CoA thioesterase n=1 Tax=Sphingomonas ginkgonis TaxID=2315330 RepID=UPI0023B34022|nr:acyl-CoA thioesterase domain-containing protein [Sphingomonas ginkgonis]
MDGTGAVGAEGQDETPEARRVRHLCRLLELAELGGDRFRGMAVPGASGRVFGGQVIAQALMAAGATTGERLPHSLHAYFLRAGDAAQPVSYQVERDFDGGRFSNRRVIARQG